MANYIRKLVSGNKARFKDEELNLDLDLVYVTDQVIIMGFPAGGLEGFYRNRREDAKKFLDHRHRNNYWVFNFCPLIENSYDAAIFGGRVSRYPFPDHHVPPLAVLALATREMRLWLDGSPERVVVLHCKAGKGRSGTLACAYLLSLDITPEPPRLQRSYTAKQWAKLRAEKWMDIIETDDMPEDEGPPDSEAKDTNDTPGAPISSSLSSGATTPEDTQPTDTPPSDISHTSALNTPPTGSTLEKVLALHTARRMKVPSSSSSSLSKAPPKKPKHGVSIPSQRRFLLYWSLLLSRTAPTHFWPTILQPMSARPKVRLRQITVRLREASGAKMTIVKVVNKVLDKTVTTKGGSYTFGQGKGNLWVSLARYDDALVGLLEHWERRTRNGKGHTEKKNDDGDDTQEGRDVTQIFEAERWDRYKMVRCFARLGRVDEEVSVQINEEKSRIYKHVLTPLNLSGWTAVQNSIKENPTPATSDVPLGMQEENDDVSFDDGTTDAGVHNDGIILDAGRELRVKLYLGQVFMGWLWFIPTFHMPQPPPRKYNSPTPPVHIHLGRKDVDFPLGIGAWIVDIDIEMSWVPTDSGTSLESPPQCHTSGESTESTKEEPTPGGRLVGMSDLSTGMNPKTAVEAVQATRG